MENLETINNIRTTIDVLRTERANTPVSVLKERHGAFYDRYPKLFDLIVCNVEDDNIDMVNFMLNQLSVRSDSSVLETDMDVSTRIADKFLFTDETRPDKKTIEECKNKLRGRRRH